MLSNHSVPALNRRPEADFKALDLPRPGGSSFDVQIFEETSTHERWIGKCNLQAASKPHARVTYQARYYDEYKEWLGMTLYRLLGVPTPEVALSLQKVVKPEGTKADMEADYDYVNPCQHIMSKFMEGFHPYGEDFLNTYSSSAREQKDYLYIEAALTPQESPVTTRIPLRGFGAALAVADFLYDLDCVGRSGGNIGYVIALDEDGKPYAKTIKIDAGLAFNFLEEYKYEEDIKNFEHHPKRRDIIYAPDKALTLHFDQLTKPDQQEFATMAKRILEIPWSIFEETIQQVVHKEGFSIAQANRLRQKLLDRKQTFLKAFYPEVDKKLRVQVQHEREEVLLSLTQQVIQAPQKSVIIDTKQADIGSNEGKEKTQPAEKAGKKEGQETLVSILTSLRQQEQRFGKNQGNLQTILQHPDEDETTPKLKKETPCRIFQKPIVTPFFTGREVMLGQIAKQLQTHQSSIVSQGISGLGGVGKTQLAARYVQLAAEGKEEISSYDVILWLDATRDIGSQFLTIAYEWYKQEKLSVPEAVAFVYRKLVSQHVLIVFDNVEDEQSLLPYLAPPKTITEKIMHWWLPGNTHILITSRNPNWEVPTLKLDGFTLEEGIAYVRKKLPDATDEEIKALLETVAYLPLALSHAVAYIREGYCTIADYPQQFALHQLSLGGTVTTTESGQTVLTTFLLTLARLQLTYPAAESVLKACAYFAPNEIPEDLLQHGLSDEKNIQESIHALMQHGLLQIAREDCFNIHSLVQESVRAWQEQGDPAQLQQHLKHWAMVLIAALDYKYQDNTADVHRAQGFITHALQMAAVVQKKFSNEDIVEYAGGLFSKVGKHQMYGIQNASRAHLAYTALLAIQEFHYGKDHMQIASTLMDLGNVYGVFGDAKQQKALLERALIINKAYYGKDHVEVARILVNLGNVYHALGDVKQQKVLLKHALTIQEAHYGKDHVDVVLLAATLTNLGRAYEVLGDAQQAKTLLSRALIIQEAHYGKDHIALAATLQNLGLVYEVLGDIQQAKALLEHALAIREGHYGKDHVEVASTLTSLSNAYGHLGDAKKQKALLERALIIQEAHYGKDHVELATTLMNLGVAYFSLGDVQQAKTLLEHVLTIQEAHYGKDYVHIAITRINLAATLEKTNLAEAISNVRTAHKILASFYGQEHDYTRKSLKLITKYQQQSNERALIIQEAHYGKDHIEVAGTLMNLGLAYGTLGNTDKKKVLLKRALRIKENHYGKDHVEVAEVLMYLGATYDELGNSKKRKALLERALPIQENHYGKDHVKVAGILANLGNAYGELGDTKKAIILLERALPIQEVHYGKDHVDVAGILVNLGLAYGTLGNTDKKKVLLKHALRIKEGHYGKDHVDVAETLMYLGATYGELEDNKKAIILLERALPIQEVHYGKNHVNLVITLANLVAAYRALGDTNKKKALLKRVLKIEEGHYGKDGVKVAESLANLGATYGELGNTKKAIILLERALSIQEAYYGKDHVKVAVIRIYLVTVLEKTNLAEALSNAIIAYKIFASSYGQEHAYAQFPLKFITKYQRRSNPQPSQSTPTFFGSFVIPKVVTKIEHDFPGSDNSGGSSAEELPEFGKGSFFHHPVTAAPALPSTRITYQQRIADLQTEKTTLVPNNKKISDSNSNQEEALCDSSCSPCSLM